MNMAISGAAGRGHATHARPANFGQLNSAIARGDLTAAQSALTALHESTSAPASAVRARGSLEGLAMAVTAGDLAAATKALADFRAGRAALADPAPDATTVTPEAAAPAPAVPPVPDLLQAATSTTEQIVAMLAGSDSSINISA